jgi:hypothetical protein
VSSWAVDLEAAWLLARAFRSHHRSACTVERRTSPSRGIERIGRRCRPGVRHSKSTRDKAPILNGVENRLGRGGCLVVPAGDGEWLRQIPSHSPLAGVRTELLSQTECERGRSRIERLCRRPHDARDYRLHAPRHLAAVRPSGGAQRPCRGDALSTLVVGPRCTCYPQKGDARRVPVQSLGASPRIVQSLGASLTIAPVPSSMTRIYRDCGFSERVMTTNGSTNFVLS